MYIHTCIPLACIQVPLPPANLTSLQQVADWFTDKCEWRHASSAQYLDIPQDCIASLSNTKSAALLLLLFYPHFHNAERVFLTSREWPKSASYLRLKNIQGTTIGNIWNFFFEKKVFCKKSRILPKNPKRDPLGSLNVFYNTKTSKNSRGYSLIEFKKFRKNVA